MSRLESCSASAARTSTAVKASTAIRPCSTSASVTVTVGTQVLIRLAVHYALVEHLDAEAPFHFAGEFQIDGLSILDLPLAVAAQ